MLLLFGGIKTKGNTIEDSPIFNGIVSVGISHVTVGISHVTAIKSDNVLNNGWNYLRWPQEFEIQKCEILKNLNRNEIEIIIYM